VLGIVVLRWSWQRLRRTKQPSEIAASLFQLMDRERPSIVHGDNGGWYGLTYRWGTVKATKRGKLTQAYSTISAAQNVLYMEQLSRSEKRLIGRKVLDVVEKYAEQDRVTAKQNAADVLRSFVEGPHGHPKHNRLTRSASIEEMPGAPDVTEEPNYIPPPQPDVFTPGMALNPSNSGKVPCLDRKKTS
jgi:hypothetical protein